MGRRARCNVRAHMPDKALVRAGVDVWSALVGTTPGGPSGPAWFHSYHVLYGIPCHVPRAVRSPLG